MSNTITQETEKRSYRDPNIVVLVGRLTRDPELRTVAGDKSVCEMRLAVNGIGRKGSAGFVNLTAWAGTAENCAKYLGKGSKVLVHGRLAWEEWETPERAKRSALSVVAEEVKFLDKRGDRESDASQSNGDAQRNSEDVPF